MYKYMYMHQVIGVILTFIISKNFPPHHLYTVMPWSSLSTSLWDKKGGPLLWLTLSDLIQVSYHLPPSGIEPCQLSLGRVE